MRKLEFFFDYASPWSYMAFCRVGAVAEQAQASLEWRPVPMGEVFRKANHGLYAWEFEKGAASSARGSTDRSPTIRPPRF